MTIFIKLEMVLIFLKRYRKLVFVIEFRMWYLKKEPSYIWKSEKKIAKKKVWYKDVATDASNNVI